MSAEQMEKTDGEDRGGSQPARDVDIYNRPAVAKDPLTPPNLGLDDNNDDLLGDQGTMPYGVSVVMFVSLRFN